MQTLRTMGYTNANNSELLTEFERLVGGILFLLTRLFGHDITKIPHIEQKDIVGDLRQRLRVSEILCECLRDHLGIRIAPHELTIMNEAAVEPVLKSLSVSVRYVEQQQQQLAQTSLIDRGNNTIQIPIHATTTTTTAPNKNRFIMEIKPPTHNNNNNPTHPFSSSDDDDNDDDEDNNDNDLLQTFNKDHRDITTIQHSIIEQQSLLKQAQNRVDSLLQIRRQVIGETLQLDHQYHQQREKNQSSLTSSSSSLTSLVRTNERLKKQEKEFKSSCKQELKRLEETITRYQTMAVITTTTTTVNNSTNNNDMIIQQLQQDISTKRKQLAWLTRANTETRKTMELETFQERNQYEIRFHELSEQAAMKTDLHKALVTKFNALTTQLSLLQRENDLLESINQSLDSKRLVDPSSFEEILSSLNSSQNRVEERIKRYVKIQRTYEDELSTLLEQQRLYSRHLKELTKLCEEPESLHNEKNNDS
jgi:hypothetical protein